MKYTIEGFSQERSLAFRKTVERKGKEVNLKLDCTDLVILRWFVDFYPDTQKIIANGKEYAWICYSYVLEQIPLLDITKKSLADRLKKLCEFEILEGHVVDGNRTTYGFGSKYKDLIDDGKTADEAYGSTGRGVTGQPVGGLPVNQQGVTGQPVTIDYSIIHSSIKDSSISDSNPILYSSPTPGRSEQEQIKVVRHCYGEYNNVRLSDPELEKLQNEFPNDWQERINKLSGYMASTGKTYKSHLATIRNWARMEQDRQKTAKQPDPNDGWAYLEEQYQKGEL